MLPKKYNSCSFDFTTAKEEEDPMVLKVVLKVLIMTHVKMTLVKITGILKIMKKRLKKRLKKRVFMILNGKRKIISQNHGLILNIFKDFQKNGNGILLSNVSPKFGIPLF